MKFKIICHVSTCIYTFLLFVVERSAQSFRERSENLFLGEVMNLSQVTFSSTINKTNKWLILNLLLPRIFRINNRSLIHEPIGKLDR
jgi:hypothetical protein